VLRYHSNKQQRISFGWGPNSANLKRSDTQAKIKPTVALGYPMSSGGKKGKKGKKNKQECVKEKRKYKMVSKLKKEKYNI
jgi:hypothetical protein